MLADGSTDVSSGKLDIDIHKPAAWLEGVVAFISVQLPLWRDDPLRPNVAAETKLTAQLCQFLNSATRNSALDNIIFQPEVPDPHAAGRTLDLVPAPLGCTLWIGGKRYTLYDPIIPIECKRLPTPKSTKRERREYLHTQKKKQGGVQRFKCGFHGATHDLGVMIGYVQTGGISDWHQIINRWIAVLVRAKVPDWTSNEILGPIIYSPGVGTARSVSMHDRPGCSPIALHHLWVEM